MATYEELVQDEQVKDLLEELQAKHPGKRLRPIETAAGMVVCAHPSRPQFTMYMAQLWDDDKNVNAKAHETLLRATVVHPAPAVFAQWLDAYPGLAADKDVVYELRLLSGAAKDSHGRK